MDLVRMLSGALSKPFKQLMVRWIQVRLIEPSPDDLALEPTLPILYVLAHPALSDTLLLDSLTRAHGLPPASGRRNVGEVSVPACLALPSPGRGLWRRGRQPTAPLQSLIEQYHLDPARDVQLVPVSVFWRRAPDKRFGVWQMLAADSWRLTGRLHRLLAERLALLSGLDAPEFFDTRLFAGLVESLEAQGWIRTDDGRLTFDDELREAARRSRALFDPALRYRLQLVSRQGEG
ncbi:hypothetical protein [Halomonas aquatica]|uniref:GPAT/DHAPAT C-terminal domain-containing protein n=1 Tax=Halomonas aquatica TaxID=3151123 RepID=A0ABV1NF09_9GAMM